MVVNITLVYFCKMHFHVNPPFFFIEAAVIFSNVWPFHDDNVCIAHAYRIIIPFAKIVLRAI